MATPSDSIPAPAAHGPVTIAIRDLAADHDPSRSSVVWLAGERAKRPPTFRPIAFSFPLNDRLWGATYLGAVRFAAEFLSLNGRGAVDRLAAITAAEPRAVINGLTALTATIEHLEEVAEALRTARSRLRETGAHLGQCQAGRMRQ